MARYRVVLEVQANELDDEGAICMAVEMELAALDFVGSEFGATVAIKNVEKVLK